MAACVGVLAIPKTLFTLAVDAEVQDRDLQKILRELPHAQPHIARLQAACERYASIFPVPLIWPAKMQAIESGYNPDAVSNSFAVGSAQFMHTTARDLGAHIPGAEEFKTQDEALSLRKQYQTKIDEAVALFRKKQDKLARSRRTEAQALQEKYETLHTSSLADFKQRMFSLSDEARRGYDARFDPAASDDMLVHYLAIIARSLKKELDLIDEPYILLLAAVAYNAGPERVKRKPGIPVVGQNVEYANKLMLFQGVKF